MKYFFSLLERKSFVKIFSICFVSLLLLTGFTYSEQETSNIVLGSLLDEKQDDLLPLFPPKKVSLIYADERIEVLTYEESVKEILDLYDLDYCEINDIIYPTLDSEVKGNVLIRVVLVETDSFEEINEIPFETIRIADSNLNYGKEVVEQIGRLGLRRIIYEEIFENNELVEKRVKADDVILKPVNKIVKFGTKTSTIGGKNCPHWFSIVDKSTSNEREREILKSLIKCESKCNDSANNRNTYIGLLQFNRKTFSHYGGSDIWNGEQQILAALKILRSGGLSHHWPSCSRKIN
jgi:hypothetical protein